MAASPVPIPLIIMYVLLVPCAASFTYFRCRTIGRPSVSATLLKGVSTWIVVCAALVGTILPFGQPSVFSVLIIAGLVMGLSGDVAISLSRPDKTGFTAGMFFFGLGHLCYIVAMVIVSRPVQVLVSIPVFMALYSVFFSVLLRNRSNLGQQFAHVLVYGIVIIYMLSLSVTMPFSVLPLGLILFFAGIMFVASDVLMAKNNFSACAGPKVSSQAATIREVALLVLYFTAQSLFAVSVYYFV